MLGYTVVVPTGDAEKEFSGMIKLNETSADIWKWIDEGLERDAVVARYMDTYGVGEEVAAQDVDAIIGNMKEANVFE